ncbi:hypothetical protein N431DRAFT_440423 [Stipitochalara longipes BDJ]|nr:hypothetical protein N431DRAFT_440423 [Stipitochalara longipes BDJ]
MAIIPFTSFLLTSSSEMLAQTRNSSSLQPVHVQSQLLMPVVSSWKDHLERKQSKAMGWIIGDSSQDSAEMIILLAVFLLVVRAFWVWGGRGWEMGREWWEERERRHNLKEWMMEERKARREGVAVVGILRGEDDKRIVRKRVSWEKDGRSGGEKKIGDDLEGQRGRVAKGQIMVEEGGCGELVLDTGLPLSCLGKSL